MFPLVNIAKCVLRSLVVAALLASALGAQQDISPLQYLLKMTVHDVRGVALVGAEICLNGRLVGETDAAGQYFLARKPLLPGTQTLSVSLLQFVEYSRPVVLPSNGGTGVAVDVQLQPATRNAAAEHLKRGNANPQEANCHLVRIFYVTDRQDTGSSTPAMRFANARAQDGKVSFGTADVSIPRIHHAGELESPSWLHLEFRPDADRHIILQAVNPISPDAFYPPLNAKVERSKNKEVVVFVHGFNSTFEEAARRLAQFTYDLQFDGALILYSWPSQGRVLAYTEDEDSVQWTAFHLRAFLEELAQQTKATKIHLIAHSMGSRALTSAMQVIAAERRHSSTPVFSQVVLAAPDIGADTLELPSREIRPVAKRITLYASGNYDSLILSSIVHGVMRAGGAQNKYLLVAPGLDTVDASDAQTDFLGHAYFDTSATILTDIQKIFTTEAPPELRNLLPASFQNLRYWILPAPKSPGPEVIH